MAQAMLQRASELLPMNPPATAFRDVLGRLPTGVVVITSMSDRGPVGVACNSFASASLSPPLVSCFVSRASDTWPHVREAGSFVANILSGSQGELCRGFARKGVDRFAGVRWEAGPSGAPRIQGALAWIDCRVWSVTGAGDHWAVLGEVIELHPLSDAEPLVFFRGRYHCLPA
jgi:3-hydroxy-9,10-secoandrosta-1,3,5(10)-triene-9,17-dione monooxygenase reductase component